MFERFGILGTPPPPPPYKNNPYSCTVAHVHMYTCTGVVAAPSVCHPVMSSHYACTAYIRGNFHDTVKDFVGLNFRGSSYLQKFDTMKILT